jgi:hypothetical protein
LSGSLFFKPPALPGVYDLKEKSLVAILGNIDIRTLNIACQFTPIVKVVDLIDTL